jgi:tetratricopeptide (TPR) repeat protein
MLPGKRELEYMAKIPLRVYLHEIEMLIERAQIDEAVAHCRHILETLPKNFSAYRMLGKAFLEAHRFSDAADIFNRVLSTQPDDFLAHIGMSIIREDEKNLDAAIWHMERAFEVQPYNSAIQNELRRLYGIRDRVEPPKVRLTRGALARMYARGDLYQQAISELRAGLAEDPDRADLQVMLARMYFMAGQRVEAVEVCSTLLKKLPYCLEANRIIAAVLPDTERREEAKAYQQRLNTLDPYLALASPRQPNADTVPDNAVLIEKLEWQPGQTEESGSQPDWAASLGLAFQSEAGEAALPDWLSEPAPGGETEDGDEEGWAQAWWKGKAPGKTPLRMWESPSQKM